MNARVLLLDNYDSFTYNLLQALQMLGADVVIRRNDRIDREVFADIHPTHLVISPGPGRPEQAGTSVDVARHAMPLVPVLGVCLGHQAIARSHDIPVDRAPRMMHGKASPVYHDRRTIYEGLANPFIAGRYHSLTVQEPTAASEFVVSAYTSEGEIMGIRHRTLPTEGIQFHPESVLTPDGQRLLRNFLDLDPPEPAP